ncbi:uncharacterized protein Smg6 isoform X2 [Chelonus insularis]|uniref:uncharacterized protein Smg6 isoform X2 n=1 Tax=Chelonus insularis TaxID=460826 RepID=UPI001588D029|nr:uncharacterized protein LOC118068391 isoform X2 [Chelonus insularis]
MANHDKGRRKWIENSQENKLMGGRRGGNRGPQPIYRPGSGPLKKSDRSNDDPNCDANLPKSSVQDRIKHHRNNSNANQKHSPDHPVDLLANKINDMTVNHHKPVNDRSSVSEKSNHLDGDSRKKNKKPEQQLYVPKKLLESTAEQDISNRNLTQAGWDKEKNRNNKKDWDTQPFNYSQTTREGHRGRSRKQSTSDISGNQSNEKNNKSRDEPAKRYSGNRKNRSITENDKDNWPLETSAKTYINRRENQSRRNLRQGSESPNNSINSNVNNSYRIRDTRSVESARADKFPRKPPSGRRNNKIKSSKIDTLPPRLQKKYLAENGLEPSLNIINNIEEPWENTQGLHNNYQYSPNLQQSQMTHSLSPGPSGSVPLPQWSNTLPTRSRGRGRFRPEELDIPINRPGTPDQYSAPSTRSHTPSQEVISRSYDRRGSNSTMYTSMESLSRADTNLMPPPPRPISPVASISNNHRNKSVDRNRRRPSSPSSHHNQSHHSERMNNSNSESNNMETSFKSQNNSQACVDSTQDGNLDPLLDTPTILDWSEEVEPVENVQNECLSRSSSVISVGENLNNSGNNASTNSRRNHFSKKKTRKRIRKRTGDFSNSRDNRRENSRERQNNQYNRENDNYNNSKNNSNNRRFDSIRGRNMIHHSRESSKERGFRNRLDLEENWRTGKRISVCESEDGRSASCHTPLATNNSNPIQSISPVRSNNINPPGVLILPEPPQSPTTCTKVDNRPSSRQQQQQQQHQQQQQQQQQRKILFDPNNPNKPIIVPSPGSRSSLSNEMCGQSSGSSGYRVSHFPQSVDNTPLSYMAEHMSNAKPSWYDPSSDSLRTAKNPVLLLGIEPMDRELQWLLTSGGLAVNWDRVEFLRQSLQQSLKMLLETDIKFCQAENVENHFWKILFYNIIEMLRKIMPKDDPETRDVCKKIMLTIIDQGTSYFENLLIVLENTYKFKLDSFLTSSSPPTGLGLVGLALVSAQKIFLFLGDLARYKEQANETTNYGKSRQWYVKAQRINPKNGRPFNQLALLAHYARRKLDAVYYYMRSLMASNPFLSSRESLIALFDENRKKYESTERKRKEEREWKERARMKEKEGANNITGGLRRETWYHPDGKKMRRTTSTANASEVKLTQSDLEDLAQLSSVEVNRRFVTSYLHVHGKLITKIGMETFQEAGIQMLREFRALLQHSPLPLPGTRLLQLLALNMFAIDSTKLKDTQMEQGYRSEVQERALIVSLQMFSLILERAIALLKEELEKKDRPRLVVDEDMQVLLPTIKIWCDWLVCHSLVWFPPPSCTDYRVGPPGDAWSRLATMVNLLEKLPYPRNIIIHEREATGRENELSLIKLPEDTTLAGFTPLMSCPRESFYADKNDDMEVAQVCLRMHLIVFFGQEFLCGLETPVLKLQKNESGVSEYVSLVETLNTSSPNSPPEQSDSELLVDSYSEEEEEPVSLSKPISSDLTTESDIRLLIERKEELERRQRRQERHRQRVQEILQKSSVSVEIEVRPRQLVPDTNCFIDYLPQLQAITRATSGTQPLFTLMIPLVVLNELEGLARGADTRDCPPNSRAALNPEHVMRVAESAKAALTFARSKNPAIRCLTTRGTVLTSSTFTVEEDIRLNELASNDDRILATCLSLSKSNKDQAVADENQPRRLRRDVVLLTEDRNLRIKALARDVPVREVPDFMQWAGLG